MFQTYNVWDKGWGKDQNFSMFPLRVSVSGFAAFLFGVVAGVALLASPGEMFAQHGGGGGGHGIIGGGGGGDTGRPGGVSEKDDLKNFHRAMAIQATDEQRAAFAKIAQYTQTASDQLQVLRESFLSESPLSKSSLNEEKKAQDNSALAERATALDQTITKARAGNQNFLASFSAAQKSGLKDLTAKLAKADAELDKQAKTLNQTLQVPNAENAATMTAAAALEKELSSFQSEQLALGAEMGIVLSSDAQELTFNLPKTTNSVRIGEQTVSVSASEVASRTSAEHGHDVFSLGLTADLSELQQNITGILRSELSRSPRCGERVEFQQAWLTPLPPSALVAARLHHERWVCPPGGGRMEVAGGDATFEVKLTPSVEGDETGAGLHSPSPQLTSLRLKSEITRVEAEGFLRNLLRSGELGAMLRDEIAAAMLSTLQKTVDLKAALPSAGQSATLQKAEFQESGGAQLNLVLGGRLEFSDEQMKQFSAQLKQASSAQGTSAQGISTQAVPAPAAHAQ